MCGSVLRRQALAHPLGRLGAPNDIAGAALFLASDHSGWIAATVIDVAGGAVLR
ncbi:MAG TPA: SDR family oxidoreductase [Steroidobacteraceae bacterium]|nr:SDR family oxidoreductase [Steroidobacteraceae bacterium]